MINVSQIRKIHTLKNFIGLDDVSYHKMLQSFNAISSKNLTEVEAKIFIEILEAMAKDYKNRIKHPKKYADLCRDERMATPSQLLYIEGLWKEIAYYDDENFKKKSLRKFLKSKFKIDDIMFLTKAKATKVIQGIKGIKANLEKKKCAATQYSTKQ